MPIKRNRWLYLGLAGITMLLGLSSRRLAEHLPHILNQYLGDSLWALMVFFLWALLLKTRTTSLIAGYALLFSFGVELSQLYHAFWIDSLRQTRLGGLVLGYGFLWRDLLAYSIGIGCGISIDKLIIKSKQ